MTEENTYVDCNGKALKVGYRVHHVYAPTKHITSVILSMQNGRLFVQLLPPHDVKGYISPSLVRKFEIEELI